MSDSAFNEEEIARLKEAVAADLAAPAIAEQPYTSSFSSPIPEDKQNAWSFLKKVIEIDNTTRVGNLTSEEIGIPKHSLRTLKECELISNEIIGSSYYSTYFRNKAEILTATSLSKDGKLISLSNSQRREIADTTKPRTVNSGWFGQKKNDVEK